MITDSQLFVAKDMDPVQEGSIASNQVTDDLHIGHEVLLLSHVSMQSL